MKKCRQVTKQDEKKIVEKIRELSQDLDLSCSCQECVEKTGTVQDSPVSIIRAEETEKVENVCFITVDNKKIRHKTGI